MKLNTQPAASAPGGAALKPAGAPAGGAPAPAGGLPKATVKLNPPTKPLDAGQGSTSAAGASDYDDDEDEGENTTVVNVLAVAGFVAAAVLLYLQISTISVWEGWDSLF